MKGLGGVLEAKGHPDKLVEPKGGGDSCFGDVCFCHRYLVVRSSFEKMVAPCRDEEKLCGWGMGYLSGTEAWLRRL